MLKKNNCSDYINIKMMLHNRNKEEYYTMTYESTFQEDRTILCVHGLTNSNT